MRIETRHEARVQTFGFLFAVAKAMCDEYHVAVTRARRRAYHVVDLVLRRGLSVPVGVQPDEIEIPDALHSSLCSQGSY